jgi:hypothetical protein
MATLWSCPKSDCPPIAIAPVDVPESGESAGAEAEHPFTTDEVAALLSGLAARRSTAEPQLPPPSEQAPCPNPRHARIPRPAH